jgi:hypothetical protein
MNLFGSLTVTAITALVFSVAQPASDALSQSKKVAMLWNEGTLPIELSVSECMNRAQTIVKAKGLSFVANNISLAGANENVAEKVLVECVAVSEKLTRVLVLVAGPEDAGVKQMYDDVKNAVLR